MKITTENIRRLLGVIRATLMTAMTPNSTFRAAMSSRWENALTTTTMVTMATTMATTTETTSRRITVTVTTTTTTTMTTITAMMTTMKTTKTTTITHISTTPGPHVHI